MSVFHYRVYKDVLLDSILPDESNSYLHAQIL
jgi:hypothetical protein